MSRPTEEDRMKIAESNENPAKVTFCSKKRV